MFPTYLVTYLPNHSKDLTKLKVSLLFLIKRAQKWHLLSTYLPNPWKDFTKLKVSPFSYFLKRAQKWCFLSTYLVTYLPNHSKDFTKLKVSPFSYFLKRAQKWCFLSTYLPNRSKDLTQSHKFGPFSFWKGHKSDVLYLPTYQTRGKILTKLKVCPCFKSAQKWRFGGSVFPTQGSKAWQESTAGPRENSGRARARASEREREGERKARRRPWCVANNRRWWLLLSLFAADFSSTTFSTPPSHCFVERIPCCCCFCWLPGSVFLFLFVGIHEPPWGKRSAPQQQQQLLLLLCRVIQPVVMCSSSSSSSFLLLLLFFCEAAVAASDVDPWSHFGCAGCSYHNSMITPRR